MCHMPQSAKSEYYYAHILDCGRDNRALFPLMDGLLGRGHGSIIPVMETLKDTVDSFSEFFSSKIQKIRNELDAIAASVSPASTECVLHFARSLSSLRSLMSSQNQAINHVTLSSPD